ncbi:SpoIVB peptidase S55 domain-containing protein [Planctomycetota bacterium]
MLSFFAKRGMFLLHCLLIPQVLVCASDLDKSKYIGIDEIKPGMQAYCLTIYKGTEIERFSLEVISVIHKRSPGRDAILVQGTDERFIHTGPVMGCSGSPVYIDGRMAGALSYGWSYSKDPLYEVTLIEDMLKVGQTNTTETGQGSTAFAFDFSKPIDLAEVDKVMRASANTTTSTPRSLLVTSGLSAQVCEQLDTLVRPLGFTAVQGIGAGQSDVPTQTRLVPGACVAVPIVAGDIAVTAIGTVTEVQGEKVYSLGHGFLGYGPVDLPMATGQVHTVVSNLNFSFKLARPLEVVGALRSDESAGVVGIIGAKARTIPMRIEVVRYNEPQAQVYNCQVASNRLLTPSVMGSAMAGAALKLGSLGPDNMIKYKAKIVLADGRQIVFENLSTSIGLIEMLIESTGSVALMMNNPYKKTEIKSMDFEIQIESRNSASHIWSVDISDSRVKAGDSVEVSTVIESAYSEKKRYRFNVEIPETLARGRYELIVCGGYGYQKFIRKTAPYKYTADNFDSLVEVLNSALSVRRDRLYCLLTLPVGGVAVGRAELPDLPATKAMVLGDKKRTLKIQPYSHWLEESLSTDSIVVNQKKLYITVEQ